MPKYTITIKGVDLDKPEQAEQSAEDLRTIVNALSATELHELSQLLKEKPGIVAKAKQFRHLF